VRLGYLPLFLRVLLVISSLVVFWLSRMLEPLYRARPQILLEGTSFLLPPDITRIVIIVTALFLLVWIAESFLYRKFLHMGEEAWNESLRSYMPLAFLLGFAFLFVPAWIGLPMIGWWLLLDGGPWIVTLAIGCVILLKASLLGRYFPGIVTRLVRLSRIRLSYAVFGVVLFALLLAWTPQRRFAQSYDERWGTGDEPRYVRITASLLHDADADISNADELIGKRAEPGHFLVGVASWIPSTFETASEAVRTLFGTEPSGKASHLGGPVVQGRKGGTYYVFLPGFPLLLVPSMAVDSFLGPEQLTILLFTCLLLGVACTLLLARLVEPFAGNRLSSYGVVLAVAISTPLFFYHSQVYTEVTATICLTIMLLVLLTGRLNLVGAISFGLAGAFLPWLHAKYLPLLSVCLLAYAWRAWRDKAEWKVSVLGLLVPFIGAGLQCLYVFHITGSLLPDAIWVLRGYPRGATLFNRETLSGLYFLILGRSDGILVYAPLYVFALPGVVALWRKSRFATIVTLTTYLPYLLIAASHDQGGAGGWSPPGRYLLPAVPALALYLAAWLGCSKKGGLRWTALFVATAASLWIAQGMLSELNFAYDRPAFLASGIVNPSPVLGSVLEPQPIAQRMVYPFFLTLGLALLALWERRGWPSYPTRIAAVVVVLILAMGSSAALWSQPRDWLGSRGGKAAIRLRPTHAIQLALPVCGTNQPRLRFTGAGGPHAVTISGLRFRRELRVPSRGTSELEVSPAPVLRITNIGTEEIRVVEVRLHERQEPLFVQGICR